MMESGLEPEVIAKIRGVFKTFPKVETAILYGSRAKGNYRNGSDIDLALTGSGLNLNLLGRISIALDDLMLPYIFDLSVYDQIGNPDLLEHIKRVGVTFYSAKD
jgi:uncharacterized protein